MSFIKRLKTIIGRNLVNIPGWRTDRKIVVFESDDWGAVRMSSKESLGKLAKLGLKVENCHYMQNDALASEEDLTRLFKVLRSHRSSFGRHPVITANVILTNPDFGKISNSDFQEYHYELFTDSLASYPQHKKSYELWRYGMEEGFFYPQFHGREHLQVLRWMHFLKNPESETRMAFEERVFGLSTTVTSENRASYLASYDWDSKVGRNFVLESVSDGLSLFKSVFGYESSSSIAPNYVWHRDLEKVLSKHGVRFIQGAFVQKSPDLGSKGYQKIRHYTGQKNSFGQRYLVRNCKFEPSSNSDLDWVERCLDEINTAFLWKKPAIIEMHRVNFIGFVNEENRERNLQVFDRLLGSILKKWPEVEFMTSEQLGKVIEENE